MAKKRLEMALIPLAAFAPGFLLYGLLGVVSFQQGGALFSAQTPWAAFLLTGLLGGYAIFFGVASGLMFTKEWLSRCSLAVKILMAVLFLIPVYSVLLGGLYGIPYCVYNFVQYARLRRQPPPPFGPGQVPYPPVPPAGNPFQPPRPQGPAGPGNQPPPPQE